MEQAHLDRYLEYVRAERGLGARTVDEYGQEVTRYRKDAPTNQPSG